MTIVDNGSTVAVICFLQFMSQFRVSLLLRKICSHSACNVHEWEIALMTIDCRYFIFIALNLSLPGRVYLPSMSQSEFACRIVTQNDVRRRLRVGELHEYRMTD